MVQGESSKAETIARRLEHGLLPLVGRGIDVGAGTPESVYGWAWWEQFPEMQCRPWDRAEGDAAILPGVTNASLDWLYASHLLEHLEDPSRALERWVQVVRPGGTILISVPHRDLYEGKLELPSNWSHEHVRFYLPEHGDGAPGTYGFGDFLRAHQHYGYRLDYLEVGDRNCVPAVVPHRHAAGEYCIDAILIVSGGRVTSPSQNATHRCTWCPQPTVDECRGPCYGGGPQSMIL